MRLRQRDRERDRDTEREREPLMLHTTEKVVHSSYISHVTSAASMRTTRSPTACLSPCTWYVRIPTSAYTSLHCWIERPNAPPRERPLHNTRVARIVAVRAAFYPPLASVRQRTWAIRSAQAASKGSGTYQRPQVLVPHMFCPAKNTDSETITI